MKMTTIPLMTAFAALCLPGAATLAAQAPTSLTAHTVRWDSTAARPDVSLQDARWLAGSWEGTGLGGQVQEVWTPPAADRMTGAFTSLADGAVRFQELMSIVEVDGSLELWVKHFNPDFSAWEEKEDFTRFRLVDVGPGRLRFGGLTFQRLDDDRLRIYLAMSRAGEVREEVLDYRRVR